MAGRLASSTMAALLLVCSAGAAAQTPGATGIISGDGVMAGSVRTTDRTVMSVLVDAYALSPTFRSIVDQLNASDLIVYVVHDRCGSNVPSCLRLAGTYGRRRYLQAIVEALPMLQGAGPLIAHELRHAVEIANAPEVTDSVQLLELYRRLNPVWTASQTRFETEQARRVERTVAAELNNPGPVARRRAEVAQK